VLAPSRRAPRRSLLLIAPLLIGSLFATACGDDDKAAAGGSDPGDLASVTLRVGDQGQGLESPLTLAGELGGAPYDTTFTNFSDGPNMNAAFSAGELDLGYLGDTPSLLTIAARADVVAVASSPRPGIYSLIATADSGVETLDDLAGKKIAYIKGTALDGYLAEALDSVGLTEADVTPVNVPGAALLTTLQSGEVDAALLGAAQGIGYLADNPGATRVDAPNTSHLVVLATSDALADPARRAAIEDFVRRLVRSGEWVAANTDVWIDEHLVKNTKQDPAVAAQVLDSTIPRWGPITDEFIAHQARQAELMIDAGVLPPGLDAAEQLDPETNEAFNAVIEQELAR